MNDIFGFFIKPASASSFTNIALLPNTSTPVSIKSVNRVTNAVYYVDNASPAAARNSILDGLTVLLSTSTVNVVAGTTYNIKVHWECGGSCAGRVQSVRRSCNPLPQSALPLLPMPSYANGDDVSGCCAGVFAFV